MTLTIFTSFIATVPNNAFQIFLNPPRRVFFNMFQRVSNRPKVVWYKNWSKTTRNKRTGLDLINFYRSTFSKLEICKVIIFLFKLGNQSSLILSIKNSGGYSGGGVIYLTGEKLHYCKRDESYLLLSTVPSKLFLFLFFFFRFLCVCLFVCLFVFLLHFVV